MIDFAWLVSTSFILSQTVYNCFIQIRPFLTAMNNWYTSRTYKTQLSVPSNIWNNKLLLFNTNQIKIQKLIILRFSSKHHLYKKKFKIYITPNYILSGLFDSKHWTESHNNTSSLLLILDYLKPKRILYKTIEKKLSSVSMPKSYWCQ